MSTEQFFYCSLVTRNGYSGTSFNPFTADPIKALHFAILV